ncbi:tumor necrosis factor receptor superfamily member 8 precursor [Mus musculus]|uniref:Tumor necrosis factor receptor superfamily member 8 n=1 Tax=Mus musculus TaxID=10090 RepID=TNR8_MOUSE|nr:tumor necrosis factor receptor superfamily member 8 precursor [Mus musculus]Q60846.1 RecName: Full=Tumor necrosis factor receptor superfamily member 8; AltName: Full=CD30L receptor; AltName: Full=Lymphocyte activation antigen CD30; AltName: CD_antigen=CD30; Flags: Precursor [Mus musculus]AAA92887.1 CD30 [Mus musculus]AAI30027.1 Tumor necrosis factor receptor superfamily, member 8 [Mus musculus]|eukprot:NP_033427.1 tumor necrosis factor receptor superfamily member 8 precursor [Mus musculus]
MSALLTAAGLLFLGMLQAFPTDRPLKTTCAGDLSHYPGEAARNCCYQCPSGLSPTQPCPRGPAHCRKQCAPDYYVNEDGKCTACVTCLPGLVEKAPCSGNSPRICECQPGMHCCTPAVNSCARCKLHCSGEEVVKSPGTAKKDTICELPSSGSGPNCSNPGDRKTLTSHATPQAMPTLESPANDSARSLLPMRVTNLVQEDATELVKVPESSSSKAREPSPDPGNAEKNMTLELPSPGTLPDISTSENSKEPASTASTLSLVVDAWTSSRMQPTSPLSTGTPFLDPGPVLFWVAMVVLLVGSGSFLLCYWKACRRRFQQKFHLDYLVQTFQPKMEQTDSCPTEKLTQPQRSGSVTDPSTGHKLSPVSPPPAVETCASVGATYLENLPLLDDSPAGNPFSPREPPEPRVSTEHTNNRIEKIYIMKADTVIVGSVKTEVPEGRAPAGSTESELEAELEVDHAPHYPEQETEPPLGSCTEVMFSVEEGGKEDHGPTTVSEK